MRSWPSPVRAFFMNFDIAAAAGVLEGHVALIGDHRPLLGADRALVEADLQQVGVLQGEGVRGRGLVELRKCRLHGRHLVGATRRPSSVARSGVARARPRGQDEQQPRVAARADLVALGGVEDRQQARAARDGLLARDDVDLAVDDDQVGALVDLMVL